MPESEGSRLDTEGGASGQAGMAGGGYGHRTRGAARKARSAVKGAAADIASDLAAAMMHDPDQHIGDTVRVQDYANRLRDEANPRPPEAPPGAGTSKATGPRR